jgi:hypothetical protein
METAEEIILKQGVTRSPISGIETYLKGNAKSAMIEFAKLHVEAALKAAAEKAITEKPKEQTQPITWNNVSPDDYNYFDVDKDSILNAYPLENIK